MSFAFPLHDNTRKQIKKKRHRTVRKETEFHEDNFLWPWKLSIDITPFDDKPKVCFLSGQERQYFPDKPGFSRHAVEYSMNCHPGDTPNPSYVPSDNTLQKPVSKKGYGIGGLSARRFPAAKVEAKSGSFMPDIYYTAPPPPPPVSQKSTQQRIPPPPTPQPDREQSRQSQFHSTAHVDDEEGKAEVAKGESTTAEAAAAEEAKEQQLIEAASAYKIKKKRRKYQVKTRVPGGIIMSPEECREYQRQRQYAFGLSARTTRFEKLHKWQNVGVGNYSLTTNICKKVPRTTGFDNGPVEITIPTKTLCDYEYYDKCLECNFTLKAMDYYRSIKTIGLPYEYLNALMEEHWDGRQKPKSEKDYSKKTGNAKPMFVTLCRKCYCDILLNGHAYWTKHSLQTEFHKIRHCYNVHEHNELPCIIHKIQCKVINKLTRFEILMNKHFPDCCERPFKEVS